MTEPTIEQLIENLTDCWESNLSPAPWHIEALRAIAAKHKEEIKRLKKALDQAIEITGMRLERTGEVLDGPESTAFSHHAPELANYLRQKEARDE